MKAVLPPVVRHFGMERISAGRLGTSLHLLRFAAHGAGLADNPFHTRLSVALNCTEAQSLASLVSDLAPDAPLPSGAPTLILYPNHNVRFLDDAAYWCVVPDYIVDGSAADQLSDHVSPGTSSPPLSHAKRRRLSGLRPLSRLRRTRFCQATGRARRSSVDAVEPASRRFEFCARSSTAHRRTKGHGVSESLAAAVRRLDFPRQNQRQLEPCHRVWAVASHAPISAALAYIVEDNAQAAPSLVSASDRIGRLDTSGS